MTVKELIDELQKYDEDLEVFTQKTEIFGNCAYVFSVSLDKYSFFGKEIPCY